MSNPLAGYMNLNTVLVFIVYSLNFLMLVGAIAMIFICLSETRQKDIMENIDINFEFLVFFTKTFMVIAIIVALVALLGCVGIAIDNDYMLIAYIVAIGMLMIAQIFLTSYIHSHVAGSRDDIRRKILDLIKGYTKENPNKLDGFQSKYACCGIDSYRDYEIKGKDWFIPGSCCHKKPREICTQDLVHSKKGCNNAIMDEIANILHGSYIIIFTIFGIEVLLAICSILVIMDVGQFDEDNTSDEIVMVSSIKKKFPNDDSKFEESIDTHDSHNIQSPIVKEEEIEGLYDEEKNIQQTADAQHDEESQEVESGAKHDDNEGETPGEEENPVQEFRGDEIVEVENVERKTHDEEIFLEGNPEQKTHVEQNFDKTKIESSDVQKKQDNSDNEDDEEEEDEEEENDSPVPGNKTKFEENIHVLKTKRFEKKKYVEKVRKERNRDRKIFK